MAPSRVTWVEFFEMAGSSSAHAFRTPQISSTVRARKKGTSLSTIAPGTAPVTWATHATHPFRTRKLGELHSVSSRGSSISSATSAPLVRSTAWVSVGATTRNSRRKDSAAVSPAADRCMFASISSSRCSRAVCAITVASTGAPSDSRCSKASLADFWTASPSSASRSSRCLISIPSVSPTTAPGSRSFAAALHHRSTISRMATAIRSRSASSPSLIILLTTATASSRVASLSNAVTTLSTTLCRASPSIMTASAPRKARRAFSTGSASEPSFHSVTG
mmetsp:Transcript_22981/g.60004  ORF Transcript_22981/g.60004 Transcript_22981/m.60004 type:complete len:278 (-) Transcript_22981:387-1220(-)